MTMTMLPNAKSDSHPGPRYQRRIRVVAVAVALGASIAVSCFPAAARSNRDAEPELAHCIAAASRGRPWLERTLWGLRDQEGGWVGAEVRNTDGSHDLGPLQVNSWWVPKLSVSTGRPVAHIRWWLIHDACFNVAAARWIFLSGLGLTRDYWKAIGIYHSPTAWRQKRYSALVAAKLRRRFGDTIFR
ncbi:hypothetical protein BH10PSE12_BH10PSE12_07640 [soil metagenome]